MPEETQQTQQTQQTQETQQQTQQQQQTAPAEWLKPFGEHAKVFEGIKDPAELATKWTAANTELTTLKANPPQYDWRKEAAKEGDTVDEKRAQALARYNDLPSVAKALVEAQNKIRSGELAKPLAADAKPEEVKAWREANGIPLEPKGYFEKLPDGLVIGAEDQPIFDKYAQLWHQHNLPPAAAHAMTKAYYDDLTQMKALEAKVDREDSQKAITALRAKMGPDYDTNMSILNNWVEGMPADLKSVFMDATLGDGTRLFNSPAALEFLMGQARKLNPAAHLLPAGGEGNIKSIDTELATLKGLMGDKNSKYWKGPESAALQKKYRDLTEASQQLKKRA